MGAIVVVGAGLAGLNAARSLAAAGHQVHVFESKADVGGRVRTHHRNGFTLDRGFQVLFTRYPAVRRDLELDALDLRSFTPGATLARSGRRSIFSDPLRDPAGTVGTILNPDVPFPDALRLLRLRVALARRDPASLLPGPQCSIEEYLQQRGFSTQFLERFARPFYGGITLDRSLSTAAGIFRYTFAMLSGGRIAVPANGMGAIPAQLAAKAQRAGATIQTDTEVREVEPASDEVLVTTAGETMQADAVVVATDACTASELTAVERIPTTPKGCTTQYFAVDGGPPFDGEHRLVLNAEGSTPNHVAPLSTVAPEYAPPDRHLVSATTLGRPGMTDEELAERTTDWIESWYPAHSAEEFTLVETDRIHFAQFDQPPGYHDTLPEPTAPDGPVFLAGDYTHWSSIQGALESGRRTATIVAELGAV